MFFSPLCLYNTSRAVSTILGEQKCAPCATALWFRSTSLIDFPKELVVLGVQSHIRTPFKQTLSLKVPVSLWSFLFHQLSGFNGLCGLNQICVTIWFKSALGEERVVISCNRMLLTMNEYLAQYRNERPLNWFWHERAHLSITLHVLH